MFTFAVLFILVRVVCTQECSTCQCCKDGYHPKCSSRGYCNNGCKVGYYGENCNYKCTSQNCLRCRRKYGHYCLKCTTGYYLNNHNCYECGPQCKSCASNGCKTCYDGYWGKTCDENCAQICASCRKSNGYCISCKPGYYFHHSKCTTCGIHCLVCDTRGCTSCHDGYWGSSCDGNCSQNCALCSKSNGYCLSCDSGYYLHHGKCTTCGTHCAVCGQRGCTSCHDGYWGRSCDENCAQNCSLCSKSDGYCLSCASGYYLYYRKCTNCGTHCAACGSRGCISCHDGYWGSSCDKNCAQNCASCSKSDGYCLSCRPGHYLNNTLCYACGTHCSSCESTGCQACYYGYWGKACSYSCEERCRESKCEQTNGYCLSCVPGYWGNKCEYSCSQYCFACNKSNGECISCENRNWESTCDSSCQQRCNAPKAEKQTTSRAVIGGGIGGGAAALAAILVVGVILLRRR
ncbi:platelet endothelial aggregation receptor 1-like [Mya arenaria]|uniref:platelet endothelial aggregation receptor 1-like n=1 Tax=Mya arenaria TaxID=6604 RepID=UPI0022E43640|nr:platelet endothelial aggregation receptor 1-like [Mya arenaria]